MTLCTHIAILDPCSIKDLWAAARFSIGTPEDLPYQDDLSTWRGNGIRDRLNPPGIGAPGWLWLHYGADGPFETAESWDAQYAEYGDDDPYPHPGPVMYDLSLDTGYGAKFPNGSGCADIHAAWVAGMAVFLDVRGIRWRWQNEFTGEWFDGVCSELEQLGNVVYGMEGLSQETEAFGAPQLKTVEFWRTLAAGNYSDADRLMSEAVADRRDVLGTKEESNAHSKPLFGEV